MVILSLKDEAHQIIDDLDIMGLLRSYGHAELVGSVPLDLIVKRDIDIHVYILLQDSNAMAGEIIPVLLDKKWVRNLRVDKYSSKKAVKIGIDGYPGPTGPWDIDIWITNDITTTGFEITKILKENLSSEQRDAILVIKQYYHNLGVLRDGLSSRIYDAVYYHNVRSVQDFKDYLPTLKQT